MGSVEWDPLQELKALQERMGRVLEMSSDRLLGDDLEKEGWQPQADIYEDDNHVVIKMDLPEVRQQDIEVQIVEQTLIVQGKRSMEKDDRQRYHRVERPYGPFRRTFSLPDTVDQEKIRANCESGVLKILLPKTEAGEPRQIAVESGAEGQGA